MKLVLALALLIPGLAQAEPAFWCRGKSGPDHGLSVTFANPPKFATLSEQTIAGPRVLAELTCAYNAIPEDATGPQAYLTCSEPNLRDAGYSVTLTSDKGRITAQVSEVFIWGTKPVEKLSCGRP